MDLEASGVARSRPRRVRRSRSTAVRPRGQSAAERNVNNQALLHAEVRAMLDEALDCELGIRNEGHPVSGPTLAPSALQWRSHEGHRNPATEHLSCGAHPDSRAAYGHRIA